MGAVKSWIRIILFILNKDINYITRIIKSLKNSDILIDGVSKTIKHELKKLEDGFRGDLIAPLAASMLERNLTGKGVVTAGRVSVRAGTGYNYMDHMGKKF